MALPDSGCCPVGKLGELVPARLDNQLHFVFWLFADDNFFVEILIHQLSDVPLKILFIS